MSKFENMENQNPINILAKMEQGIAFSAAMQEVPEVAFAHQPGCLCCSDGRFSPSDATLEKEGMAGQGILLLFNETELNDFVAKLKINPEKPQIIASHEACGAAGLAFDAIKKLMAENQDEEVARIFAFLGISQLPTTSDELGVVYTKQLAELANIDYAHLELSPEKEHHNESGIIVTDLDFDERFIVTGEQQFFNSASAKLGLSDEYIKTELTELTKIAFGSHGRMGHHDNEIFHLLVISNSAGAARLSSIAEQVANNQIFSGRVKVEVAVRE